MGIWRAGRPRANDLVHSCGSPARLRMSISRQRPVIAGDGVLSHPAPSELVLAVRTRWYRDSGHEVAGRVRGNGGADHDHLANRLVADDRWIAVGAERAIDDMRVRTGADRPKSRAAQSIVRARFGHG